MESIFTELAIVLLIATVVAGLAQFLRQPLIIGHIVTGLLVGPYIFDILKTPDTLEFLSQLGIAFLLFIIGLSLNPRVIHEMGKVSIITGVGQVLFTTILGFGIGRLLGFSTVTSIYIALAVSFSSTIIILKLLSDKKDLGRQYGRIATGFLLVQDIVAMAILIIVTSLGQDKDLVTLAVETVLKGSALLAVLAAFGVFVLPKLATYFARSQEFLFIFSISWGLGLAVLFKLAGFSIEIGALFAGIVLANSPYSYEISSRMRPLRDFFIVLFFILLGTHMQLHNIFDLLGPALAFSLLILLGNPLIVLIILSLMGYNKKTSFKAGLTVAQVSEFSMILIVLGNRVGHVPPEIVSLVTAVGLITIAISSYYIIYSDKIYDWIAPYLSVLERKKLRSESHTKETHDIILFGFDNVGYDFIESFSKLEKSYLVIDFNPEIIAKLENDGINCRYGDAADNEFLDELRLDKASMIVSTIDDAGTNALIIENARRSNKKSVVIVYSDSIEEATDLYDRGASYVLMPHYAGSTHTCSLISRHGFDLSEFLKVREKHVDYLEKHRKLTLG